MRKVVNTVSTNTVELAGVDPKHRIYAASYGNTIYKLHKSFKGIWQFIALDDSESANTAPSEILHLALRLMIAKSTVYEFETQLEFLDWARNQAHELSAKQT